MKHFKKQYLLPLFLLCGSQYHLNAKPKTEPNWFDRITWGLFDKSHKDNLDDEIKYLKKQEQKLERSLHKTKQKIEHYVKEAKNKASKTGTKVGNKLNNWWDSLTIGENPQDETQPYEIAIHLPGFKREDLKINKDSKGKQLHISGTKSSPTKAAEISFSEEFVSKQNINGKNRHFKYKDGKLDVTLDLPDNAINKNFDVEFENDTLTVSFK